jgi:hypothetical protein
MDDIVVGERVQIESDMMISSRADAEFRSVCGKWVWF